MYSSVWGAPTVGLRYIVFLQHLISPCAGAPVQYLEASACLPGGITFLFFPHFFLLIDPFSSSRSLQMQEIFHSAERVADNKVPAY